MSGKKKKKKKNKFGLRNLEDAMEVQYLAVCDVECTCERGFGSAWVNEVIELPVVMMHVKSREVVDVFHSYVRPTEQPQLTEFCTELTGITQETVDAAPVLEEVLKELQGWLLERGYCSQEWNLEEGGGEKVFALLTDGNWDMEKFLQPECERKGLHFPAWGRRFVNVRKSFMRHARKGKMTNLKGMLRHFGLQFEGSPHSGIDDSRNIARIAARLLEEGYDVNVNQELSC